MSILEQSIQSEKWGCGEVKHCHSVRRTSLTLADLLCIQYGSQLQQLNSGTNLISTVYMTCSYMFYILTVDHLHTDFIVLLG